jgi:acyl-coenzyme A thioesterase PaaI-like protein
MRKLENAYGGGCFFCGPDNPIGLRLTFYETETEPNELVCRWTPSDVYKGFGSVLHGGIQSGLFDEIMGWTALHLTKRIGVTSALQMRFLRPVFVEQEIEVRCSIESLDGARVNLSAKIRNLAGEVCTEATGTYVLMERDKFDRLVESG